MPSIEPPVWATEPVVVTPSDPAWAARGERLRRDLEALLAPWLVSRVEHVGSTAVPGLPAKPIIDLQAAVTDLTVAPQVAEALAEAGWHLVPAELDARPWRRFLVLVVGGARAAHLHLMTPDQPRWHQQLRFRDALRADPVLVGAYGDLKQRLAAEHRADREGYSAAKATFIERALRGG